MSQTARIHVPYLPSINQSDPPASNWHYHVRGVKLCWPELSVSSTASALQLSMRSWLVLTGHQTALTAPIRSLFIAIKQVRAL